MMTTLNFPRPMGATPLPSRQYECDGHRPLVGDEADRLRYGMPVTILDTANGLLRTGKVIAIKDHAVDVQFRNGHIIVMDTDNPNFWGDDEIRDRKPPIAVEDERELVMVTDAPYPEKVPDLFNAMKASVELLALRAQVKLLTDEVQALSLKYEAVLVDVSQLQESRRAS